MAKYYLGEIGTIQSVLKTICLLQSIVIKQHTLHASLTFWSVKGANRSDDHKWEEHPVDELLSVIIIDNQSILMY